MHIMNSNISSCEYEKAVCAHNTALFLERLPTKVLAVCFILLMSLVPSIPKILYAEDANPVDQSDRDHNKAAKLDSLFSILDAIEEIEKDLAKNTEILNSTKAESVQKDINSHIEIQRSKLSELKNSFAEIASGEVYEVVDPLSVSSKVDWSRELEELFSPVIRELKRATNRPRALDRLRRTEELIESRLRQVDTALKRLEELRSFSKRPKLQDEIGELISN